LKTDIANANTISTIVKIMADGNSGIEGDGVGVSVGDGVSVIT